MMEVKATILHRSVFIPEEKLVCEIKFTNKSQKDHASAVKQLSHQRHSSDTRVIAPGSWNKSISMNAKINNDQSMSIAYASAQIYCQCNLNQRKFWVPPNFASNKFDQSSKHTSFSSDQGEKGHCLLKTDANILFCDLTLKPGESKTFTYKESLPNNIPPSYKGQDIKIMYKVCIGIGRIGRPLALIRLPFRVMELKGIFKALKQKTKDMDTATNGEAKSTPTFLNKPNPFLQENEGQTYSKLDVAMDALTAFTVKRNLNTYNIHSVNGAVGKFCLSKHYYRIGEDVLGTFDFQNSPIPCVKYVVSLQIEEKMPKECMITPTESDPVHYITLSRHEECCYSTTKTNFLIPIPITATSEFNHKLVSVHWRLHFEFTIVKQDSLLSSIDSSTTNQQQRQYLGIPSSLNMELMLWDLPIHVVATNPIQASLMTQADSSQIMVL